jgi:hypothetical protein
MQKNEMDLLEVIHMLDVPEEVLGKLAEEGKLKSRRADGTIYFFGRGNRRSHRSPDPRSSCGCRFVKYRDEEFDVYVVEGTLAIVHRGGFWHRWTHDRRWDALFRRTV